MNSYSIRKVTKDDIGKIVEIYNSNEKFLRNHLGYKSIDDSFINHELVEMETGDFLSCIITDVHTADIIGVIDYKPDTTVYLSLIMIDKKYHKKGIGTLAYRLFEEEMLRLGKQSIRIDVVNDYEGNAVKFWENQGFIPQEQIKLNWGNKQSNALVMLKALFHNT